MIALILQLFWTFFVIGLFTFGGGYAVIGIVHGQVVVAKAWVTEAEFTDIVAISQMTPGPVGLNCSTYVGYEVLSNAGAGQFLSSIGSLVASLAIVLPSFLIMLAIVKFYVKFHQTPVFQNVMNSLKPAVAGLIAAAAFGLIVNFRMGDAPQLVAANFIDWKSWILFGAAFLAYTVRGVGPMFLLGCSAIAGLLLYWPF